ncbi:hypothetical protein HHI36_020954 [Cryptolaemus montrouzieri]|uniref:Uncharacterized protein n=1 Tax=Cryptolaemus montrouzieri TaxID=559131 RepID=A0ABD2NCE7_9CUCU
MATNKIKKRPRRQIPNLCRICLTGSSSMIDLTQFLDNDENIGIKEALEAVMCCKVTLSKNIPKQICSMCLSLLRISYNLKIQFELSQKKIFGKFESEPPDFKYEQIKKEETKDINSEVELIYGQEKYSLGDILIVEEDIKHENYSQFLENLGKSVTVEYSGKTEEQLKYSLLNTVPDVEIVEKTFNDDIEYETIVIKTVSDDEDISYSWEQQVSANTVTDSFKTSGKKRGGRKSKYPQSLLDKINSLIIEGNVEINSEDENKEKMHAFDEESEEESMEIEKYKKKKRWSFEELQEIEKYIIYGTGEKTEVSKENPFDFVGVSDEAKENDVELDMLGLHKENLNAPFEIDNTVITDKLVLEAMNTKNVCPHCSMSFATRISLRRHMFSAHKRGYPLVRRPKREKLSRDARIKRRIESIKKKLNKNPMLCQICGYISKSSGGAKYHSLTHGDKMYPCDQCPKKFYTPSHLKNHREYKHEAKKSIHLCPLCGEYRNSATALSYHLKKHTHDQRKYPCNICGIKFIVKSALNNHLRRHNGDRRFPCQICSKSFFTTNELKKHFMTHTGERPYQCNYCDKRFVTPYNQKVHMMTHDGPFLCEYCHKGFIDPEMLTLHLKHKHRVDVITNVVREAASDEEENSNAEILDGLTLLPQPEEDNLDFEGD